MCLLLFAYLLYSHLCLLCFSHPAVGYGIVAVGLVGLGCSAIGFLIASVLDMGV